MKLMNFYIDENLHHELKMLAIKERRSLTDILNELSAEYVKTHKDGNPVFTLDQFQEKDFRACPALFRTKESWQNYYENLTPEEYKEIDAQLNMLLHLHNKNIK